MAVKKLIEVALPLDKINSLAGKEKTIHHAHPSNLHLYWARRPLTAARAVIWASLVDDPASHPELFPSEEDQNNERRRLFRILEELIIWDNSGDKSVLNAAKEEIRKSVNGEKIVFLDPFSGGGALPLEAQRLGLESHAHDLNPVSVMINKAMIEIPSRFSNLKPVNIVARNRLAYNGSWVHLNGLADDIGYYGSLVKNQVEKKIGHLYPRVSVSGSLKCPVISWIWARMTKCPNPACGCNMPLVSNYVLSKKKGKEAWVEPIVEEDDVRFVVHQGICPKGKETPKTGKRALFQCPKCGTITTDDYVKNMGKSHKITSKLMAVVAEGERNRLYVTPDKDQINIAAVSKPSELPMGSMPNNPRWFSPPAFGMVDYADVFTNRQLIALNTFCEEVRNICSVVEKDAIAAGLTDDSKGLNDGGTGAKAYGEAIAVYLAFLVDKLACLNSSICPWEPVAQCPRTIFGRQAIPMVWDYAEANPLGNSSGSFSVLLKDYQKLFESGSMSFDRDLFGFATQHSAQLDCGMKNIMISTDPPYYDNIGYADLSDFFYAWQRITLKDIFPNLYKTMQTPKNEELIATPYRFDGKMDSAKKFFEKGMFETCKLLYSYSSDDIPVTIYYAYKQGESVESDNGTQVSSSGWETMLSAIVNAGFAITGTWPMRTEMTIALKSNINALASSIVLVCRKRPADAPTTTRRNFIQELKRDLKTSLQKLQSSNIAPVDMAQSAIGPGMGVFSKYTQVLEADGTPMSVRSALQIINKELDLYFNEQDGELDANSRFCVDFYTQYGFNDAKFGDADTLARAKNTSVATLQSKGVIIAEKGVAHLVDRDKLPEKVDNADNMVWLFTQRLTRAMSTGGIRACATLIHNVHTSLPEQAKALAYRLHSIAERKGWQDEAFAYNSLVIAWTDIQMAAANIHESEDDQYKLDI